ncbi:Alpha beta hydrolase fold protein [Lasiodiplodia theobromae]|uniref:Carboxylesterase NlhH n=1 Tax=Lasiodiplodia theobromae TaxID=45133 RepID=A0A5N5DR61_9PEZI|nr:Alpha beta hydrolase fold protein [Lasiodiplodia theobromae]KAB2579204.1 Carboxylesterase NlhH [Lasiodiplodia theobromae]KAF4537358.1 Alpha beta hydrolase fold protein [Lasiodiplodia theobromae]
MTAPNENLLPRPPYDPELYAGLPIFPDTPDMDSTALEDHRTELTLATTAVKEIILANPAITHTEQTIRGPRGPIDVSIFAPSKNANDGNHRPGILNFHGGGMTSGDRFLGMGTMAEYIAAFGAVVVSPEYRRAPEHPHPAPVEDCYATLQWVAANALDLGIDLKRLMVAGESAGGGLAAAVALMARDQGGPKLCAQLLVCPMLDDRNDSVSSRQFAQGDCWNRKRNAFGWKCLLGDKAGSEGVSYYAAPARATDMSGLPPTFIDVGSTEPFRDEDVAYASKLWECGVDAEIHVWPGGTHNFHAFVPTAAISIMANKTRTEWVRRVLERAA